MEFPSKLVENAVNEMSQLPGIGKRTALRLVLHLLKQPREQIELLSSALTTMRNDIQYCKECNTISDAEICGICSSAS
jgi:recombination protein RecR